MAGRPAVRRYAAMRLPRAVIAGLLATLPALAQAARPQPNIVLIVADDLGYGDLGCFGSSRNRTPHLDRMAAEGARLTSFYAAPVCTPSRAQCLTGSYAKRVSLSTVLFPISDVGLNPGELTIASLLKKSGYATFAVGKWHLGDQKEFLPTACGFDHYFGLPYSNDMGPGEDEAHRANPPLPLLRDTEVSETVSEEGLSALTSRYTQEALSFLRENKGRPFFLYFAHTAVHRPLHPSQAFRGRSANGEYGDWVEEVDDSVGQILGAVRELGLAEGTIVIFTSDNGPRRGGQGQGGSAGPLRGEKGSTFEGGIRVPTIAWWPGTIPGGLAIEATAGNIDFLPTFAALAGSEVSREVPRDGRDISRLLRGESKASPHEAYYYFRGRSLRAVRSGPWKLVISRQSGKKEKSVESSDYPALYNLEDDIGETTNVAARHPEVIERLQKYVAAMDADLGIHEDTPGPGVRPSGRVDKAVGLWLAGRQTSGPVSGARRHREE